MKFLLKDIGLGRGFKKFVGKEQLTNTCQNLRNDADAYIQMLNIAGNESSEVNH